MFSIYGNPVPQSRQPVTSGITQPKAQPKKDPLPLKKPPPAPTNRNNSGPMFSSPPDPSQMFSIRANEVI
jgi:hypothetical protein